ncbi:MAG TPA: hypothetical protein VK968_06210, partial [Roseimicrobium sp.]|nr:hypothetical protein [Roseimicrobium sp.]
FLLGLWHRENGDSREADRLMEAAYKNAPVVAVQQFAFADGSALAGVAVQSFALECNRVEHGSLDPTLKLYYPYLHTDARGCIYLPVYNTVLRADQMASPNGCDVAWPKLGWFEISEKVALLPVATVTRHGKGAATPATKGEAAIAEAPPREAPTTRPSLNFGPMLDGLQLALELDAPNGVLPLAEPAKARLHFRNAGQLAIKLKNPTLWQPTSNEFTVTDADGKLVQAYSA